MDYPVFRLEGVVHTRDETEDFEGPLALILQLLSKNRIEIEDISISLILDNGDCFVGDLEPYEYLEAYEDNVPLKRDWDHILSFRPKRIFYAHIPEKCIE